MTFGASGVAHQRNFLRASAELMGSYFQARGDILTSATITVEFPHAKLFDHADVQAGGRNCACRRPAPSLLFTLSPLHHISEVRVLCVKNGECGDADVEEWRLLELNSLSLFKTTRRVTRVVDDAVRSLPFLTLSDADEASSCVGQENTMWRDNEKEKESDEVHDGDVLELVFGSTDDYDDETATEDVTDQHAIVDDEESDSIFVQFVLDLSSSLDNGTGSANESEWFILRCSVDVLPLPAEKLAAIPYTRVAVVSSMKNIFPFQRKRDFNEESYLLLIGNKVYDYFICPRVAYTEDGVDAVSFTAVDVYVTLVRQHFDEVTDKWDILVISSLPSLAEDLVCAFVRKQQSEIWPGGEETHAGVTWNVQHHPAYTLLSVDNDLNDALCVTRLYFFHCDHAMCGSLLSSVGAACAAWDAVGAKMNLKAAERVATESCSGRMALVITGHDNTLLGFRRGILCARGVVVLVADVLRTMVAAKNTVNTTRGASMFDTNALRANVAVMSAALECKWRMFAGIGVVPRFAATVLNSALARAWAFCLLCTEPGWAELIYQERQIVLSYGTAAASSDPWQLIQRYVQEVSYSLVFLSSAFAVASMRFHCCCPWQLLNEGDSYKPPPSFIGVSNLTVSSGMHLHLVRTLLFQGREQRQLGRKEKAQTALLTSVLFVGVLQYEETQDDATCCTITLHLKSRKMDTLFYIFSGDTRVKSQQWNIDIPFTIVYLAIEELVESSTLGEPRSREKEFCCHTANILPCNWRVSGLSWARGLDQHAAFSILKLPLDVDYDNNAAGKNRKNIDDESAAKKHFSLHVPLLVLNNKVVPPALSLRVVQSKIWSELSSLPEKLLRRVMLRYIMGQAAQEGETVAKKEEDLLFTPLINQLLEAFLEEYDYFFCKVWENTPLFLFWTALNDLGSEFSAVCSRLSSGNYARFVRIVSRHNITLQSSLFSSMKRWRDDAGIRMVSMDKSGLAATILERIRTLEAYDATLPRARLNMREESPHKRQRLVVSLRKRQVLRQKATGSDKEGDAEKNEGAVSSLSGVADLTAMIGRVIAFGAREKDDGVAACSARSVAFSLLAPLCLLLHNKCTVSDNQRTAVADGARYVFTSLRDGPTTDEFDIFLLKAYQWLTQGDEKRAIGSEGKKEKRPSGDF